MDKKLEIPSKKYSSESIVISSRLPYDLVSKLDDVASKTGRTRNEIIQLCIDFALENLVITNGKEEK